MRNIVLVISGPSGVGKGTIAKKIIERNKNFALSISCTTRSPRVGEVDGREYFFITSEEFNNRIKNDGFLEYSSHFEHSYGTPKDFVLNKLSTNDIMLEIDVNGGLNVKKSYKDAVLLMIAPPSVDAVKERLVKRNTETMEEIELRMQRMNFELSKKDLYDYVVVNDDLDTAVSKIEEIIKLEKNK